MTCCSFLMWRKVPSSANREGSDSSGTHAFNLYTYAELRSATKDFSPANVVGSGGFGSVYKGRLKDGALAAIKVLSSDSTQGVQEFLTEIRLISNIEHPNLVKLMGCCIEGNHRILVYGYLENNSLAQTLFGKDRNKIHFSWRIRSNICIGVAHGLSFLHEKIQPHIVHRDIKASNILLDKVLNPKISDFGLAKLVPLGKTHVSTVVAGTTGYLAPECAVRGQVTRKADTYSFGVLLLEIVSGRRNTNVQSPVGEQYFETAGVGILLLQAWEMYEQGQLVELVDTSLNGDFDSDEACRYLKTALLCIQDIPKLRPSMSIVVKMLQGEIDEFDNIAKPAIVTNLMDLNAKGHKMKVTGTRIMSYTSESERKDDSSFSGTSSSYANMSSNATSVRA
ncbi:hypothetical protein Sjap_002713 [Stephania japonica]|uniref:Protein kinase domain-containing protein n=1 Tax=Stephania japonica TaxID=461633 RepID=A0AAP0KME6_9MAGN